MTEPFIHEDFLLDSSQARELYHAFAESLPIIDYHCHLPVKDIAGDRAFENLTRIWLEGDHYKWRAMRACGIDERFITGDAPDWEKFEKWAETVPRTLRNPLYHWTHLELARVFGIADCLLGPATAREIWNACNAKLRSPEFSARGLLARLHVEIACTTDDPADDLVEHDRLRSDKSFPVRVIPAFRPDRAMAVENPAAFRAYVERLGRAAGAAIRDYGEFLDALRKRHDAFHAAGCRLSDHGLETIFAEPYTEAGVRKAFADVLGGRRLESGQARGLKSALLHEFAVMDCEKGWTQQFHLGALRNANSRLLRFLGPDTGFDAVGDFEQAGPLAPFLDRLESEGRLGRTILYNVNPRDNELLATLAGCFQGGGIAGKMQFGAAWWFMDQLDGMTRQMEALSNMGLLSLFVGMTTDSRSFLSYPRHEYFRRLLCRILGREMAGGLLPGDLDLVGGMVRDICYFNAIRYFRF